MKWTNGTWTHTDLAHVQYREHGFGIFSMVTDLVDVNLAFLTFALSPRSQ